MLLLDTHILFWWVNRSAKLTKDADEVIAKATSLTISAISCWEMAWLVSHGRIELRVPINSWLDHVEQGGVEIIPVSRAIAVRAVALTEHHKDPADRIIIATAIEHQAKLLSIDQRFHHYQELGDLLLT